MHGEGACAPWSACQKRPLPLPWRDRRLAPAEFQRPRRKEPVPAPVPCAQELFIRLLSKCDRKPARLWRPPLCDRERNGPIRLSPDTSNRRPRPHREQKGNRGSQRCGFPSCAKSLDQNVLQHVLPVHGRTHHARAIAVQPRPELPQALLEILRRHVSSPMVVLRPSTRRPRRTIARTAGNVRSLPQVRSGHGSALTGCR